MKLILNLPWTILLIAFSLISIPIKFSFSKTPFAIILYVKSFWWWTWIPGMQKARAMAFGNTVLMSPKADQKDLLHELIHVKQSQKFPLIFPFVYYLEAFKCGYQKNKFEIEAYEKSGNRDGS